MSYERHSAEFLFVPRHKSKRVAPLLPGEPASFDTPESLVANEFEKKLHARVSEEESVQISNLYAVWSNFIIRGKAIPYPQPDRWPIGTNALIVDSDQPPNAAIVEQAINAFLLGQAASRSWGWLF